MVTVVVVTCGNSADLLSLLLIDNLRDDFLPVFQLLIFLFPVVANLFVFRPVFHLAIPAAISLHVTTGTSVKVYIYIRHCYNFAFLVPVFCSRQSANNAARFITVCRSRLFVDQKLLNWLSIECLDEFAHFVLEGIFVVLQIYIRLSLRYNVVLPGISKKLT